MYHTLQEVDPQAFQLKVMWKVSLVFPPSTKESNYDIHADQISSNLTTFIVHSISIYVH